MYDDRPAFWDFKSQALFALDSAAALRATGTGDTSCAVRGAGFLTAGVEKFCRDFVASSDAPRPISALANMLN